jgi:hypothetical protein
LWSSSSSWMMMMAMLTIMSGSCQQLRSTRTGRS